jgi:hypothetical protein
MATGQLSPKPGGMQGIRLALARLARSLPAWLRHRMRHCRRRHARSGEMKLISATPSPYARRVRIALAEKGIPFELQTEVPWNEGTSLPQHNPLEKLPVLILTTARPSGRAATSWSGSSTSTRSRRCCRHAADGHRLGRLNECAGPCSTNLPV